MPGPFAVLTRNGPSVLAAGVFLGLLVPALAEAARPLMPVTVFIFVLGTLLRVEPATVPDRRYPARADHCYLPRPTRSPWFVC